MLHVHNRTRQKMSQCEVQPFDLAVSVEESPPEPSQGVLHRTSTPPGVTFWGRSDRRLAAGCQCDRSNDRDRIPAAKLGGRCHCPQGWIQTVSSRGARGSQGLGRYVISPENRGAPHRPVQNRQSPDLLVPPAGALQGTPGLSRRWSERHPPARHGAPRASAPCPN